MKLTLESTSKMVDLRIGGVDVPARIWEGATDSGVEVICFITRVLVAKDQPPEAHAQFERELTAKREPSAAVISFPLRLIL